MQVQPELKSRHMDDSTLTIGEVAQLAGLKTSAIRYYESVGVLPKADRYSGQRRYSRETVRRLQIIEIAKRAGFSLGDARLLLSAEDDGAPAHEPLRNIAQRKLPDVATLVAKAQQMQAWLTLATGCDCATLDACALFEGDAGLAAAAPHDHHSPER